MKGAEWSDGHSKGVRVRPSESSALRDAVDAGGTAVLLVGPVAGAAGLAALADRLAAGERARAARFHFAADRDAYVAAHAALAALVDALEGPAPPARALVGAGPEKPVLRFDDGRVLHVNLSHSRGLVAVAASRRAAVGVDVEAERAEDVSDLYATTLSARERREVERVDPAHALFFRLWTRKEALLKALGIGLTDRLREIDVLDPGAPEGLGPWADALRGGLTLRDLAPSAGYAAVCVLERAAAVATLALEVRELAEITR